jgi:putative addiction module antidote
MHKTLKIIKVGNSAAVILPRESIAKLRVEIGDHLNMIETPDGIELSPYDPDLAKQMEVAERVMRKNRDALRELAKQ